MKSPIGFLSLLCWVLLSCQSAPNDEAASADLAQLEANLIPAIVLEGEEVPRYPLSERMEHYQVPALSMAYFEGGSIQWVKAYGKRRAGKQEPVDAQTMFQAASISKPIAATAMLGLVQEGRLELDEDVNAYLDSWKVEENEYTASEKVTLRRLVSHSAGLTVSGFPGYAAGDPVPTTVQVVDGATPANTDKVRPDTVPGTRWRYSGGGYTVMQLVMEETLDKPFPEIMEERVLRPLGMTRSTYQQPIATDAWSNLAYAHDQGGDELEGGYHTYPEMAAAGLWTTPSDLARWAMAVQEAYHGQDERLLTQATAEAMLTRQFEDYGLGPGLMGTGDSLIFSHGGSNAGFRCFLFAFARAGGPGLAIMTNGARGSDLGWEVVRGLADQQGWGLFEPEVREVIERAADSLAQYEGRYAFGEEQLVTIERAEQALVFTLEWNGFQGRLLPEGPDRFFDPTDGTTIRFYRAPDGAVAGLREGNSRADRVSD